MTINFTSKISKDFSRAAQTYDANASLQRKVSEKLFALFTPMGGTILDIGCGTGYFHELLRKNKIYQPLVQADIALGMCQIAAEYASPPEYGGTYTCAADMHNLPFADNSFANIFSSMTIQWAHEPARVFAEIHRTLKDGGQFALSIVSSGSLVQLQESFEVAGYSPPIHNFVSMEIIEDNAKKAGLFTQHTSVENITLHYDSLREIILSIKAVGASYKGKREGGIKGKGYFDKLEKIYKHKFSVENGLPLSWNIIYMRGIK